MVEKYPDLERGESASETGRDHIPPRLFKEMTRLTRQRAKLEALLSGANTFNAKGRLEEISKLLDRYIPGVEQMDTALKKYRKAFSAAAAENQRLKVENAQLGDKSVLKRLQEIQLQRERDEALAVLERIPPEVLAFYRQPRERVAETCQSTEG